MPLEQDDHSAWCGDDHFTGDEVMVLGGRMLAEDRCFNERGSVVAAIAADGS